MKYWEIIANRLKKAGWSLGWFAVLDLEGRTMWIVDAQRDQKRFIVHADDLVTAFVELERQVLTVTRFISNRFMTIPLNPDPNRWHFVEDNLAR